MFFSFFILFTDALSVTEDTAPNVRLWHGLLLVGLVRHGPRVNWFVVSWSGGILRFDSVISFVSSPFVIIGFLPYYYNLHRRPLFAFISSWSACCVIVCICWFVNFILRVLRCDPLLSSLVRLGPLIFVHYVIDQFSLLVLAGLWKLQMWTSYLSPTAAL